MKKKIIFFCGHMSPYGLAHLEPILKTILEVEAIVIATDNRWSTFRESLIGKAYYRQNKIIPYNHNIYYFLRNLYNFFVKTTYKPLKQVKDITKIFKIPLLTVEDVNQADFIEKIKQKNIDYFFSAAYPQIFQKSLIDVPQNGCINFHPSLLPKFRGAHPHFWAIATGEKESGITAHLMTEKIDAGPIVAQLNFPIKNLTYSNLYNKLINKTPDLIALVEVFINNGNQLPKLQNEKVTSYFRNDRDIHKRIFWTIMTAQEIHDLCRTEMAFCFFRGKKIDIFDTYVSEKNRNLTNDVNVEPGTIIDINQDGIAVKTKEKIINIRSFKYGNKKHYKNKMNKKHNFLIGEKFD